MYYPLILLLCFSLYLYPIYLSAKPLAPQLMLGKTTALTQLNHIQDYWISEKYDGVRAYWNGSQLLTRQGHVIHAPNWFTSELPDEPVEGELWIARNKFDQVSAISRKHHANDKDWQQINFMLFDLPNSDLPFELRQRRLLQIVRASSVSWLQKVRFYKLESLAELQSELTKVVEQGAEGLMLNLHKSYYMPGRHANLLKLKPYFDDEAVVVQHLPGKGKYQGLMGALLVKRADGSTFKIGTGFSDKQRQNPPAIGQVITYKYYGKTTNGLPRFASYLRNRDDKGI